MEQEKPKIELYRTREFTEKLSDTFAFLRENWRMLLKYFTYSMLPASLVLAFFMSHFWTGYMSIILAAEGAVNMDDSHIISFFLNAGMTIIVGVLAYAVLLAVVFALFRLYRVRSNRLCDLSADEFNAEFKFCMKRSLIMLLFMASLAVVIGLVLILVVGVLSIVNFTLGIIALLLFYALIIVVAMPLSLMPPIYFMEDKTGVFAAFKKTLRLGFATWGGIFLVTFIIGLLTGVIQSFTMVPWYILFLIKTIFTVTGDLEGSFVNSIFYTFMEYLSCVLQCLGYMVSAVITLVAVTVQYGHASDKIDGVGVAQNIEHFDEFDNF